jgi:hypothetical protein
MVWLIDLAGMSARMVSPTNLQMSLNVLRLLQNHYPEVRAPRTVPSPL